MPPSPDSTSDCQGSWYEPHPPLDLSNSQPHAHAHPDPGALPLPLLTRTQTLIQARFLVLYLQNFGFVGLVSFGAVGFVTFLVYQTLREQLQLHGAPTAQLSVQELPQIQSRDKWKGWQPMTEAERKSK